MPEIVLWKRGFHNGFTNITDRTMKANAYIPALTGVRAIAAFLVFFHHANQAEFPFPLFRVLNEFHIGVTVFFVLSGFLICLRYYDTCEITGAWFRKYLKNRIARIYPMYMVLTLGTFAYAWYTNDESIYNGFTWHWGVLLMNIFFFRGFFDDLKFTGVAQGWSLTVEECFYFSAPFFFRQIKKDKRAMIYLPLLVLGIGVLLVAIFSNFNWWGFYGNYRFRDGNKTISKRMANSAIKKGITPFIKSDIEVFVTPATTFKTVPTGGVINPILLLIINSTPK